MNTPQSPELYTEQVLELLSQHIASNDRVIEAVERVETALPIEAERILTEHRQVLANRPAPKVTVPAQPPRMIQPSTTHVHIWGIILACLILACSTVVVILLHR